MAPHMGENAENVAARLWRDRAQIREDERDEAQARARIAEEKLAALIPTYGPPRPQEGCSSCLHSLRQRIRSQGCSLAKMEIRAVRSS